MIDKLIEIASKGSENLLKETEEKLKRVLSEKGENFNFELPDTAYGLPLIYALEGFKINNLSEIKKIF